MRRIPFLVLRHVTCTSAIDSGFPAPLSSARWMRTLPHSDRTSTTASAQCAISTLDGQARSRRTPGGRHGCDKRRQAEHADKARRLRHGQDALSGCIKQSHGNPLRNTSAPARWSPNGRRSHSARIPRRPVIQAGSSANSAGNREVCMSRRPRVGRRGGSGHRRWAQSRRSSTQFGEIPMPATSPNGTLAVRRRAAMQARARRERSQRNPPERGYPNRGKLTASSTPDSRASGSSGMNNEGTGLAANPGA